MRKDMKDVIVNTGRHGGNRAKAYYSRAYLRDTDPEELPNRLPMNRHRQYGYDSKELGDRIAPLRAYLHKQVGRPWADVWHDICEHADYRTIRGLHLRQHVWIEVERDRYRGWGETLFIDTDGTLQLSKDRSHRFRDFKPTERLQFEGETDIYYEKIEGIWYRFETTHTTQPCSREDLTLVDGEVQIIRIPMPDTTHHETVKQRVDGDTRARLDAAADEIDWKWLLKAA